MDVQGLGRPKPVDVPHVSHQRLACDHAAGVPDQAQQQVELLAGEVELRVAAPGAPRSGIDTQVPDRQRRAVLGGPPAPEDGPDPGDHLAGSERLDHVVVGADLQPDNSVGHGAACRHHDDRHIRVTADSAAEVTPVDVGKREIEQDHVRPDDARQLKGRSTARGDLRPESGAAQRAGERLGNRALVLYEQDDTQACAGVFIGVARVKVHGGKLTQARVSALQVSPRCDAVESSLIRATFQDHAGRRTRSIRFAVFAQLIRRPDRDQFRTEFRAFLDTPLSEADTGAAAEDRVTPSRNRTGDLLRERCAQALADVGRLAANR